MVNLIVTYVMNDIEAQELDKNNKIQNILNTLISEEFLAGHTYLMFSNAVKAEEASMIRSTLYRIYADEINDHYMNLVKWAVEHDYSVPVTIDDMYKYANEEVVKQHKNIKKNKPAKFYLEECIKAELLAIASYTQIINEKNDVLSEMEFYDLKEEIIAIYNEECEHLLEFFSALNLIEGCAYYV